MSRAVTEQNAPFPLAHQLVIWPPQSPAVSNQPAQLCLPGYPSVRLDHTADIIRFLRLELRTAVLDKLAPHLWVMTTQSSSNIQALHAQALYGRQLVLTEDPGLHLVKTPEQIFFKPLPKYLLSHQFWKTQFSNERSPLGEAREDIVKAAKGLLRTYKYLIQHESDLRLAQDSKHQLLEASITWEQWCVFRQDLGAIADSDVSPRYQYGELRLTRLNFYIKIFLGKYEYKRQIGHYGPYFARFYGPLLFVFAVLTILLGAMQVEMAVESIIGAHRHWQWFWHVCRWTSVLCLATVVLTIFGLLTLLLYRLASEWTFAVTALLRIQHDRNTQRSSKI